MDIQLEQFNIGIALALRAKLAIFKASPHQSSDLNDLLQQYLKFYMLPLPTDHIALHAGTSHDSQIAIMSWSPPQPTGTVIIVHGYMDHIGLYGHLIEELLNRKLTVLCFDAQGHGLSDGACCSINHFSEYVGRLKEIIALAQRHYESPLHAVGQSMGGAVLMKHLLNEGNEKGSPFASINLLAPLLQPRGWKQSRHLYYFSHRFIKSIKRVFRPSSWDKDFLNFLKYSDPLQPTRIPLDWVGAMDKWVTEFEHSPFNHYPLHIIQGNHDKTLDWLYNLEQFKRKFPAASVNVIDGANHHLVNESESLRKKIFAALQI